MGGRLEYSIGSTAYLMMMITLSLLINVAFLVVAFLAYLLGMPQALFWNCSGQLISLSMPIDSVSHELMRLLLGFWVIIFAFITMECLAVSQTEVSTSSTAAKLILCLCL
jgi:hypothetical protein